jgi:hypothetical protein
MFKGSKLTFKGSKLLMLHEDRIYPCKFISIISSELVSTTVEVRTQSTWRFSTKTIVSTCRLHVLNSTFITNWIQDIGSVCVCKLGLHRAGALPRRGINPQASAPSTATSVNQKNVLLKLISVEKFLLDLA